MRAKKVKRLLRMPDVAERLSIGTRTVYRLIEQGRLRIVRISGGIYRVDQKDLERFVKKNKTKFQEKFDF